MMYGTQGKYPELAELYLLVGLPNSGKSTKAAQISEKMGMPIVCIDSVRYALHGQRFLPEAEKFVWATAHAMVKALFLSGHQGVILDATNTTKERRKEWHSKNWKTYFIEMPFNPALSIERARQNNDEYIIPIIEKMAAQYETPSIDE